jgi:hypothetical protein
MKTLIEMPELRIPMRTKELRWREERGYAEGKLELEIEQLLGGVTIHNLPEAMRIYVNGKPFDAFALQVGVERGEYDVMSTRVTMTYNVMPSKPILHPAEVLRRKRKGIE